MKKILSALLALSLAFAVHAQTAYPLFQPSDGIMVGDVNTYVTTSASASDVISLWSGSCTPNTLLRGDGSCGIATVAAGGTGDISLSGVLKGNGTSPVTSATSGDVIALWGGTCNSTAFLRGDGSCAFASTAVGANPTASLGLTAVNGVASTFMRSDAAPALSQSIAPTWTATHVFANNGANASFTGNDPRFLISESDGNVDEKNWLVRAVTNQFNIATASDASPFSAINSAFTIGRSGTGVGQINLSSGTANVVLTGTGGVSATVGNSGITAISGLAVSGQVVNSDLNPSYYINEGDAAADEKLWRLNPQAGDLLWSTRTDANGAGATFMAVARTGTTVDSVTLSPTSSVITGNARLTTLAGTAANPNLQITSASPNFGLFENDATANNGLWIERPVAEQLRFSACNDAGSTCTDYLNVDRTGTTVDSIALAATAITLNGVASSDFARLSQSNTFTGTPQVLSSTSPELRWNETDAAVDNKLWYATAAAETLGVGTRTDAGAFGAEFLTVNRTGTTVDSIALAATAVTVNGQNVCRQDGTGCPAGAVPGGANTQVQFNNSGVFGGDADFVWDSAANTLTFGSGSVIQPTSGGGLTVGQSAGNSSLTLRAAGASNLLLQTNGSTRLTVETDGSWNVAGSNGTNNQILTSAGASASPTWQTITTPANAANIYRLAGGSMTDTGAACSLAGGFNPASSCTRNSTGNLTLNFPAFGGAPLCTATGTAASRIAFVSGSTTTTATVVITDLAGTAVAGTVNVHCFGI